MIRCKKCRDVIESCTVHDFKFCSCESCAVEAGMSISVGVETRKTGKNCLKRRVQMIEN